MYKTVSAKATEETKIIKFSFKAFKDCFEKYPEDLAKVVQVVMIRLQRVTLLALHQYLGLGAELLTSTSRGGKESMYSNPSPNVISYNVISHNVILFLVEKTFP